MKGGSSQMKRVIQKVKCKDDKGLKNGERD